MKKKTKYACLASIAALGLVGIFCAPQVAQTKPLVAESDPLYYLPPNLRAAFLESLVFTPKGLASFNYSYFSEANLSAAQVYEILSLYGVGYVTHLVPGLRFTSESDRELVPEAHPFTDYENFWCVSDATCAPKFQHICIGDNCGH